MGTRAFLAAELARYAEATDSKIVDLGAAVAARMFALTPDACTVLKILAIAAGPVPVAALARCLSAEDAAALLSGLADVPQATVGQHLELAASGLPDDEALTLRQQAAEQ